MNKYEKRIVQLENELEDAYRRVTILTNKVEALNEKLQTNNQQLEEANRTIKEQQDKTLDNEKLKTLLDMAGAAVHEMSQPLTVIMGYIELLGLRDNYPPNLRDPLEKIYQSAKKMRYIVLNIQKIYRYKTKNLKQKDNQ